MDMAPPMCKVSPSAEERAVFAHVCATEHTGDGLIHADSVQTSITASLNQKSLPGQELNLCYLKKWPNAISG